MDGLETRYPNQFADPNWLVDLVLGASGQRDEAALLTAQMAVEACASAASRSYYSPAASDRWSSRWSMPADRSFMDPRSRRLRSELTGTETKTPNTWKKYTEHIKRRN